MRGVVLGSKGRTFDVLGDAHRHVVKQYQVAAQGRGVLRLSVVAVYGARTRFHTHLGLRSANGNATGPEYRWWRVCWCLCSCYVFVHSPTGDLSANQRQELLSASSSNLMGWPGADAGPSSVQTVPEAPCKQERHSERS